MTSEELSAFEQEWQAGEVATFYADYVAGKPVPSKQIEYVCAYTHWLKKTLVEMLLQLYDVECVLSSGISRTSFELSQATQKKKELMSVLKTLKDNTGII